MRRVLALLTVIALLFSAASAAEKFKPKTAAEGKQQALSLLETCGFRSEYGAGANGHPLQRWESAVSIWVGGKPTAKDLSELDDFLLELNFRVPWMPTVKRVKNRTDANVTLYFVKYKDMSKYVTDYVKGSWGMFTFWEEDNVIVRAQIAVASDKTAQKDRFHILKEEIFGVLGLANDHERYADSIIYQPYTTVRNPSEVDWLMLNMLYHPDLTPGMTWAECRTVLNEWIQR